MSFAVRAFYKFFPLPDYALHRQALLTRMQRDGIRGSILLAAEGVNGTISGTAAALADFHAFLEETLGCAPLGRKESVHDTQPFRRAKVRLKKELISLGEPADPQKQVGRHVAPAEWNALLARGDVIVIDARNAYETHLGRFQGAIDPGTRCFSELPAATLARLDPAVHRHVATYCTGGIRCEKYTAWLLDRGFEEVSHLEGGILAYLAAIPATESLFEGDCYVFDQRIALGHDLAANPSLTACGECGHPLRSSDRAGGDDPLGGCRYCRPAAAA